MIIADNDMEEDDDFAEDDDMDHFHKMQDASKEAKTKKRYAGCIRRLIKWLARTESS